MFINIPQVLFLYTFPKPLTQLCLEWAYTDFAVSLPLGQFLGFQSDYNPDRGTDQKLG